MAPPLLITPSEDTVTFGEVAVDLCQVRGHRWTCSENPGWRGFGTWPPWGLLWTEEG